jgi:hypothetical protein
VNAKQVKSAQARATIARNLYVNNRTGDFHRNLDDCFEMGDGDEVCALLAVRVRFDEQFRLAVLRWRNRSVPVSVVQAALEVSS